MDMVAGQAGREALEKYLAQTIVRLRQSQCPVDMLRNKVMPSVVDGIKNLSCAAPQATRDEFRRILMEGGVLPNYEADFATFEEALQLIHASVQRSLEVPSLLVDSFKSTNVAEDEKQIQKMFHDYVKKILSKLRDPASSQPDAQFTAEVLPQILSSLQRLSLQAPVGLKVTLARILTDRQLWPHIPIGMDPRRKHVKDFPENAGVAPTKPAVLAAMLQIHSMMQRLESGSPDAYSIGLTAPVNVDILGLGGEQVSSVPLERGTSAAALRKIMGACLNCPEDMLSFVQGDTIMKDTETCSADCQIVMVRCDGDDLSGVYAGYSRDLLILYPDGSAVAWEAIDPWQSENKSINSMICDDPLVVEYSRDWAYEKLDESDPKNGHWTVKNGLVKCVSATYDAYSFSFEVKHDKDFSEGISPLVLDGVRHEHAQRPTTDDDMRRRLFPTSETAQSSSYIRETKRKRFYLVSKLAFE